ncbi:hypothetical protein PC116_g3592 [Phytophthora cactorum]|uniref:SWIM-type domain-containing protein n=1 Tax=Phytophthora cactorum TaxID=29920 RepID=A0A329SZZ5_9STRA|nr:hypothetical protein Pcac1_g13655 [Phytophthora cactorum]KAG2931947.1 hypothetical protein PC114_g1960 [Phytophthora cactorum]KAG2953832.1 hypothetical protein PC117_g1721 [Phytophthora cactorum]KAG3014463.1 hypothetical protein PC120_g12661 [Phytophthora cactorum]KAG3038638.1 hypothetical protein PC119_g2712 [Phytophthora cactorum]
MEGTSAPWVVARVKTLTVAARKRFVSPSSEYVVEVMRSFDNSYAVVNVQERTCSCGRWQEMQFPCIHACAAILFRRKDLLNYVSAYYSVVKLQAAFEGITLPVDFNTITNDDRSMASAWTPQSCSVA